VEHQVHQVQVGQMVVQELAELQVHQELVVLQVHQELVVLQVKTVFQRDKHTISTKVKIVMYQDTKFWQQTHQLRQHKL
jgi:hypothetical protein